MIVTANGSFKCTRWTDHCNRKELVDEYAASRPAIVTVPNH